MSRFKERKSQLMDILDRIEAKPSSVHIRNALSAIERLRDDGDTFWDEDSNQLRRWQEYCTILWMFLNTLGKRRYLEKQDLATALREFIQEFEHSTAGMYEMLYGAFDNPDHNRDLKQLLNWFDLIYRFSTYALIFALISFWIDDKTEEFYTKIKMNMATWPLEKPHKRRHETRCEYQESIAGPQRICDSASLAIPQGLIQRQTDARRVAWACTCPPFGMPMQAVQKGGAPVHLGCLRASTAGAPTGPYRSVDQP